MGLGPLAGLDAELDGLSRLGVVAKIKHFAAAGVVRLEADDEPERRVGWIVARRAEEVGIVPLDGDLQALACRLQRGDVMRVVPLAHRLRPREVKLGQRLRRDPRRELDQEERGEDVWSKGGVEVFTLRLRSSQPQFRHIFFPVR